MQKKLTVSMERQIEKYNYPSPFPPKKRKAEIFQKEKFAEVDNYARKVKSE